MDAFEQARKRFHDGQRDEALAIFRQALHERGAGAALWAEFSTLLLAAGRAEEAVEAGAKALAQDPANLPARLVGIHGHVLLGQFEAAERLGRESLERWPASMDIRLALGDCLVKQGDLEHGRQCLEEALRQDPAHRGVRNLLGEIYLRQGDWESIRNAIELQMEGTQGPLADLERASLELRFGDMPQGWARYESRWQVPDFAAVEQHYPQPRWTGEPFPGKTLLLFWEQGFGDTLMFVRYAAKAKALGGRVILAAQAQLADLVATCPGIDQVIPHGQPLPPFDLQLPLLSLPWVFKTDMQSIPAEIPYLSVPGLVPHRREIDHLLKASEGRLRIGLVWSGSPGFKNAARKGMHPRLLEHLSVFPEVAWFSFQVGGGDELPFPGVQPLEPLLGTFSDTAHALSAMDLVITIDTAVAHLAGAMGIPVFLLVAALPDWRWLMGRTDSPWYPTLRLYRQPAPGDWAGAIRCMVEDLAGQD